MDTGRAQIGAQIEESRDRACADVVASSVTLHVCAYIGCALIWGTTWYGIRLCIGPGGYSPFPAAALRFTLSTIILCSVWFFTRSQTALPQASRSGWILVCGLLSGVSYGLLYIAEEKIPGGIAAVVSATSPIVAAVVAAFTKTERLSKATLLGLTLALIGVAIVFHDRMQVSSAEAWAVGLMILNCTINAASMVGMKRHVAGVAPVFVNVIFFAGVSVALWVLTLLAGRFAMPASTVPTIALLYLSIVGTVVAFSLYFYLLRHIRLSAAMSLSFVTPIVALIVDAFFEKHILISVETITGIIVVLAGVVLNMLSGWFVNKRNMESVQV